MQDSCRPFLTALQPQTHNTSQSPTSNPKGSTYLFRRYDWAFLAPTSILSNHESPSPFVPYVRPISLTFTHPLSLCLSLPQKNRQPFTLLTPAPSSAFLGPSRHVSPLRASESSLQTLETRSNCWPRSTTSTCKASIRSAPPHRPVPRGVDPEPGTE